MLITPKLINTLARVAGHSALGGDLHVFVQTNQTETSFLLGPNIAPGAQSSRYFQPGRVYF